MTGTKRPAQHEAHTWETVSGGEAKTERRRLRSAEVPLQRGGHRRGDSEDGAKKSCTWWGGEGKKDRQRDKGRDGGKRARLERQGSGRTGYFGGNEVERGATTREGEESESAHGFEHWDKARGKRMTERLRMCKTRSEVRGATSTRGWVSFACAANALRARTEGMRNETAVGNVAGLWRMGLPGFCLSGGEYFVGTCAGPSETCLTEETRREESRTTQEGDRKGTGKKDGCRTRGLIGSCWGRGARGSGEKE
ncbi:hypothetical protein TRVL_08746 [Trypanosoma vivax]|nr:hypothetical protein TRVL_08746 [Trypanosoma vivax]